jgi:O-antigen/teichoic acid export membrane protein
MNKKIIARNGMIYTGSAVLAQAISVLLVPVFTRNISQADFGLYSLMISVQSLLAIFSTAGIISGLSRFYNEFEDRNLVKNTALIFVMILGGLLTILSWFFGESIYNLIFGFSENGRVQLVVVMGSTALLSITAVYAAFFNMQDKAFVNSLINVGRSLLLLGFSLWLILYMQLGVLGALLAQLGAYGIVALILLVMDRHQLRIKMSRKMLIPMLKYSLGLIPGQISGWVYTLIDRYIIKLMLGLAPVAVYSMGYRLGMMMEPLFLYPFKSIFTAFKYREYKSPDAQVKIRMFFTYYVAIGWFVTLGISTFARAGILILSTEAYIEAAYIVPLIVFAYFLYGLGEFFSMGIHIANKTGVESVILFFAAGLSIMLNFVLIPKFGIFGAAITTVVSYMFMTVVHFYVGRKLYDTGIGYFEAFRQMPVVLAFYGMYLFMSQWLDTLLLNVSLAAFICLIYLAVGYWSRSIPREAFDSLVKMVARKVVRSNE